MKCTKIHIKSQLKNKKRSKELNSMGQTYFEHLFSSEACLSEQIVTKNRNGYFLFHLMAAAGTISVASCLIELVLKES